MWKGDGEEDGGRERRGTGVEGGRQAGRQRCREGARHPGRDTWRHTGMVGRQRSVVILLDMVRQRTPVRHHRHIQ